MAKTTISWTQETINPVTGCDKISEGCRNCYALKMILRLQDMKNQPKYRNGTAVTCHDGVIDQVLTKKRPTEFFVSSMSDTFHPEVPLEFLQHMFTIMGEATQHHFQILTKRAERLAELAPMLTWHSNIWMGVTVESNRHLDRIKHLKSVPAQVRFISIEPLLDDLVDLTPEFLTGIHWVIVGGESGVGAREMKPEWARRVRDIAIQCGIPFFFKQAGSFGGKPHKDGDILDGRTWTGKLNRTDQ